VRIDDQHREAALREQRRGRQPSRAGADNDDVESIAIECRKPVGHAAPMRRRFDFEHSRHDRTAFHSIDSRLIAGQLPRV
jgi:hypothetical protein